MSYKLLQDINGDFCPKILLGLFSGFIWVLACAICLVFAIGAGIKDNSLVISILTIWGTATGSLLTIPTRIRSRDESDNKNN